MKVNFTSAAAISVLLHVALFIVLFAGFSLSCEDRNKKPSATLMHATVIDPSQLPKRKRGRQASAAEEARKQPEKSRYSPVEAKQSNGGLFKKLGDYLKEFF